MQNTFSHSNILQIFPKIKVRSLISWSERKLIIPIQDAAGRGSSRIYSYSNLIEIGIISELFRYSLSFFHISSVMRDDAMQSLLKNESWDTIFWFAHGTPSGVPNIYKEFSCGSAPITEFKKRGGEILVGPIRISNDPFEFASSAIIVNVGRIKDYVDHMITKL